MRTPRLPVVGCTDAPADLNGLVRFAERRNLVSAQVPSHFKRSLLAFTARRVPVNSGVNWIVVNRIIFPQKHTPAECDFFPDNGLIPFSKTRSRTRIELQFILILLESCLQTCMTYTIAERRVNKLLMMDRRTVRNTYRVSWQNKYMSYSFRAGQDGTAVPSSSCSKAAWHIPCIATNFFVIKLTGCTNFTNLFCHETLHVSESSSVHHQDFIRCTLSNCICHTGL